MSPVEASKKKDESIVSFNLCGDMEQLSSKPCLVPRRALVDSRATGILVPL